ncbi:PKD domain protein [compost metagenome]
MTLTNPITVTGTGFSLGTGFGTTTVTPGSTTTFTVVFSPNAAGNFIGNIQFGTNDCDEGTTNFVLNGLGVVSSPVADFSAAQTTVCQGTSIVFTNLSTFSTSYSWTFTGGTPSTSTATNPTITYNTAGTYAVTLVATNANGSDMETKTAYITVVSSTASALPLTEGFATATFPPTGWSIQNNNNSATTWARSATVGLTPTAGNSMWFDNYQFEDADDDIVRIKPLVFTGYSSAQLVFSVAYARYNNASTDGLEVLVSTDCGLTFTSVYSKSGATLATTTNTTNAFAPNTAAQWRSETVNLTPYVGQANVIVAFKNLSAYGNNIYVDNINITGVATATPPTPSFNTTVTSVCAGQSVTYNNTSTGSPTSYSWSFPGGTPATSTAASPTVTYSTAGTYNVVLTATNGSGSNTSTMTNYVTVNAVPAAPAITTGGSVTFCAGGSVTLTSSAGTSYLWSNGATTQSITATTAGAYTVQVTNTAGCQSVASAATTVTVNPVPSAPTITAGGAITFCSGSSVTLTSTTGASYLWSTGATTQAITVTTAGTYTCKVVNASGCQSPNSNSISVTVNPTPTAPTITAGGTTTFCSGSSVVLNSTAGASYLWSNGATTQSITVTTAGTYTCKVVNASGCQSPNSNSISVTVNPTPTAPTISAGGATTFCSGSSVTLTSTGGSSYLWSNGATTQSITATSAGTYTCKVINGSGCQSPNSNSISVTVNPTPTAPTITAGGTTTFCSGGSVVLNSTAGTTYLWSNGATAQSITATTAGSYTVQVTNASGCQSVASAATTVTVNPTPAISLGTVTNPSACATNTGSIAVNGSGSGTISWSGTASGSTSIASLPTTIPNLGAGSYTIVLTSGAGCASNSVSGSLTDPGAPTPPVITASSSVLCPGNTITLTSSYSSGNTWSEGSSTPAITVSSAGVYTVSVSNAGCTSTSEPVTIIASVPFTVNAGSDQNVCAGNSVILTGTATGSPNLGWNNGVQNGVSFVPTATTTYTLTGTDANGCQSTDQVIITVNANPTVSLGDLNQVCTYTPSFTLTGGFPLGGNYSGTGVNTGNFNPAVSGAGTFPITYSYMDANGCSGTAQSTIVVDECLSLSEQGQEQMLVYPNPTSGMITLVSDVQYHSLEVIDAAGRIVWRLESGSFEKEQVIDLTAFSNGQYILRVKTQSSIHNYSLIVNK